MINMVPAYEEQQHKQYRELVSNHLKSHLKDLKLNFNYMKKLGLKEEFIKEKFARLFLDQRTLYLVTDKDTRGVCYRYREAIRGKDTIYIPSMRIRVSIEPVVVPCIGGYNLYFYMKSVEDGTPYQTEVKVGYYVEKRASERNGFSNFTYLNGASEDMVKKVLTNMTYSLARLKEIPQGNGVIRLLRKQSKAKNFNTELLSKADEIQTEVLISNKLHQLVFSLRDGSFKYTAEDTSFSW